MERHLTRMHGLQLKTLTGWLVGTWIQGLIGLFLNSYEGQSFRELKLERLNSLFRV
jgi:hypothetical protein